MSPSKRSASRRSPILVDMGLETIGSCLVRVSSTGRSIRLTFSRRRGLTVTTPTALNDADLRALLENNRCWLEQLVDRIASESPSTRNRFVDQTHIRFDALDCDWSLRFEPNGAAKTLRIIDDKMGTLTLRGRIDDIPRLRRALRHWLARQAGRLLGEAFHATASSHGFSPSSLRWETMRSRWGSCSSKGRICLNSKLLFLSKPQIAYVFLHELCHTRVMNHSAAFYDELEKHLPNHRAIEAAIKEANRQLPVWLDDLHD